MNRLTPMETLLGHVNECRWDVFVSAAKKFSAKTRITFKLQPVCVLATSDVVLVRGIISCVSLTPDDTGRLDYAV